jgi:hypothetical protein
MGVMAKVLANRNLDASVAAIEGLELVQRDYAGGGVARAAEVGAAAGWETDP